MSTPMTSASFAHASWSYGLICGLFSVRASLNRMKEFMWLSAR